ncbi:MAG: PTS sugar transporter subunit IIA [Treponema sp.]|nr:PTS sugar transporter subunit IIA [Treponema sp.]
MFLDLISLSDIVFLESVERDEALSELLEVICRKNSAINRQECLNALIEREDKMTTVIKKDIAVPHAVLRDDNKTCIALGISKKGVDFDESSPDKSSVHLIIEILFEQNNTEAHLAILKDVLELTETPDFFTTLVQCETTADAYRYLESLK